MELGILIYGLFYLLIAGAAIIGLVLFLIGLSRREKSNTYTVSGLIIGGFFGLILFSLNTRSTFSTSNTSLAKDDVGEITGSYKFIYPSGQVEALKMNSDNTYTQMIYFNVSDFSNDSQPRYKNTGTWWKPGSGGLVFDNWLICCDSRDPKVILANPYRDRLMNINWYAKTSERNELISVCEETGYLFEKYGE